MAQYESNDTNLRSLYETWEGCPWNCDDTLVNLVHSQIPPIMKGGIEKILDCCVAECIYHDQIDVIIARNNFMTYSAHDLIDNQIYLKYALWPNMRRV